MKLPSVLLSFLISFYSLGLNGQDVFVSQSFNMRGDYAYEVLGEIEENVLLYRDKGFSKKLVALDSLLDFKWEKELQFEKNKMNLFGLVPQDSCFLALFGFREDKNEILRAGLFNSGGNRIDTFDIHEEERGLLSQEIQMVISENKTKSLLYYNETNNKMRFFVFDNDTLGLSWQEEFIVEDVNFDREIRDIKVSDTGDVFILLERNNSKYKKEKHVVEVMGVLEDGTVADFATVKFSNLVTQSLKFSLNSAQDRIGLVALYHDKKNNASKGYAFANVNIYDLFADNWTFTLREFNKELIYDLRGDSKEDEVKNLRINDMVWRQDDGFILLLEEQRIFSRRQNYGQGQVGSDLLSFRGWTDYFNEDIAMISIHPDGEEHWRRVMYKKQFSQDDGAVFSSYFLFKTPSRLRLIYNDEIKNNNTVSEYVIGPLGKNKRASVLSTEYQDLKLRFQDAIQTSNSELYVTSEKNSNLSIVKIKY